MKKQLVTIQVPEGSYVLPPKDVKKCVEIVLKYEQLATHFDNSILFGKSPEKLFEMQNKAFNKLLGDIKKLIPHAT